MSAYPSAFLQGNKQCATYVRTCIHKFWVNSDRKHFPAPQPVSICKNDLDRIDASNYLVTEKSDGVRYLLVLGTYPMQIKLPKSTPRQFSAFVDRKFQVYQTRVAAQEHFYNGTIFDGELVWEFKEKMTMPRQLFFIFDIVACSGVSLCNENFINRYKIINTHIDIHTHDITDDPKSWQSVAITLASENSKIISLGNQYCLQLRHKLFLRATNLDGIITQRTTLRHHSDGLIFMPITDPIAVGTHKNMFKWKEHNTIDLLLVGSANTTVATFLPGWNLEIYCTNNGTELLNVLNVLDKPLILMPNSNLLSIVKYFQDLYQLNWDQLVECKLTVYPTHYECDVDKTREDKHSPNHISTLKLTIQAAVENIQIIDLKSKFTH